LPAETTKAPPAPKFITIVPPQRVASVAWNLIEHHHPNAWKLLMSYLQQALPASTFRKGSPTYATVSHHALDTVTLIHLRPHHQPQINRLEGETAEFTTPMPCTEQELTALFKQIAASYTPAPAAESAPVAEEVPVGRISNTDGS